MMDPVYYCRTPKARMFTAFALGRKHGGCYSASIAEE